MVSQYGLVRLQTTYMYRMHRGSQRLAGLLSVVCALFSVVCGAQNLWRAVHKTLCDVRRETSVCGLRRGQVGRASMG